MDTLSHEDEILLKAIKKASDPDYEPERGDADSLCDSDLDSLNEEFGAMYPNPTPIDPDMERLQNDTALRQHLKIGTAFTGPKGVKQDYEFHKKQEREREREKRSRDHERASKKAMSSGWLQRTIEEEELDENDLIAQYRLKRLQELAREKYIQRYGSVLELHRDTFVTTIDNAGENVPVIIHLFEPGIQACRLINDILPQLAKYHPYSRFCKIIASVADRNFDQIALPAFLVYRNGELSHTLLRINDEIPGWNETGRISLQDLEEYLQLHEIINYRESESESEKSEEDEEDEYE